jgi:hypothetical protein
MRGRNKGHGADLVEQARTVALARTSPKQASASLYL